MSTIMQRSSPFIIWDSPPGFGVSDRGSATGGISPRHSPPACGGPCGPSDEAREPTGPRNVEARARGEPLLTGATFPSSPSSSCSAPTSASPSRTTIAAPDRPGESRKTRALSRQPASRASGGWVPGYGYRVGEHIASYAVIPWASIDSTGPTVRAQHRRFSDAARLRASPETVGNPRRSLCSGRWTISRRSLPFPCAK